jgi:hypothetical protein
MSFAAVVRSSLVFLALPALAAPAGTARKVSVPDHGAFEISLPDGWRYSTEPSPEGGGDTLRLEPPSGDRFVLMATPVWVPENNRDARSAVGWMRVRLYNQTVEQDIQIEEFKGSRNTVYWFTATNRNPAPGEHEAMVQGAAMVGELLVGFTLLHHDGSLPERKEVLKALGSARHLSSPL